MSRATQLELFPDLKVDSFDTFTFNGRYLDEHGKPTNSKAQKNITADNLEKAKKIYTVNTSINYIIDVLNTSCDEYVIYAHDDNNKSQIDYLFLKPHKMLCR